MAASIQQLCGWVPHPEDVIRGLAQLEEDTGLTGQIEDDAPHIAKDNPWDGKTPIKLWDACKVVTGDNLAAHKQTIGDCVSHGHGEGVDYLQCLQIAMQKNTAPAQFVVGQDECYTEAIYGSMRRGKGMGNGDGASGIWAVQALSKVGYPRRKGRAYNGNNAKLWGRVGTPADIEGEGKELILKQYVQVRQASDAANLLFNGYPITVCSNQGFTMSRNADGICEAQGSWGHCMLCIGCLVIGGNRVYIILQSWGQNVPSGATIEGMPNNSFGARENVFQRMLNANDSWALSSEPGIPAQSIDFMI